MNINIMVTNVEGKILSRLDLNQLTVIQGICSFKVENAEYAAAAFRSGRNRRGRFEWDGYRKLFNVQAQTFPIGLLHRIISTFTTAGIGVNIIDRRTHIAQCANWSTHNIENRQYQDQAVITSLLNGSGIVKAATGSGKTTIGAKTIAGFGKPCVFIVHTKDLLYQTKDSFEKIFGIHIGQIGDCIVDIQPITIATVQTLAIAAEFKYESYKYDEDYDNNEKVLENIADKKKIIEWARTVGLIIFDEVQRVCSRTAYAARFIFPNADNVFGYSASPWRDDGSDLMIEAAFGPRIIDIPASDLIRQKFLVKPIITIRNLYDNVWSGKTYEQIYKSAIVENMFRNMQVVSDAHNEYISGKCTLVLVTQIKHGEILEGMLRGTGDPAVFISGRSGMKKRRQVISDMRSGNAPIVIASTIADVGLDVPRLQSIVEAGAGKSSVTALQRVGRIMRPFSDKDLCYFTTYHDMAPFLNSQIDNKIRIWQTEPEFIISRV